MHLFLFFRDKSFQNQAFFLLTNLNLSHIYPKTNSKNSKFLEREKFSKFEVLPKSPTKTDHFGHV